MSKFFLVFLLTFCFPFDASADLIKIGIADYIGKSIHSDLIKDSVKKLSTAVSPRHRIEVKELDETQLKNAVEQHEVDLFIASSLFYRQMLRKGARDLVSIETVRDAGPNKADGSVLLVNGNRNDLLTLENLKGKHLAFSTLFGESSLKFLEKEILDKGLSLSNFFKKVTANDIDMRGLLELLEKNTVDAIVVPVCYLERFFESTDIETDWLKVLESRHFSSLRCEHSTMLYPGFTLASLPSLNSEFSKTITQALLGIGQERKESFWSVSTDFSEVDRLLRSLNLDAWASERKWTLKRIFSEFWYVFTALFLIMLCLLTYSSVVSYVVNRRTKKLKDALQRERILKKQALEASRKIEEMQRIGAFSQLCSLFAHELGQPLYAIRCFCFSLQKSLSANSGENSKLLETISDIDAQAIRADEIVRKTRDIIKGRKGGCQKFEINEAVQDAIETFKMTQHGDFKLTYLTSEEELFVLGDSTDIDLIVINLLRNSFEAGLDSHDKRIWIEVKPQDAFYVSVSVFDNAEPISEKILSILTFKTFSSKSDGLGLGLKIVNSLVEGMGGKLKFSRSPKGGLKVSFLLPLAE